MAQDMSCRNACSVKSTESPVKEEAWLYVCMVSGQAQQKKQEMIVILLKEEEYVMLCGSDVCFSKPSVLNENKKTVH